MSTLTTRSSLSTFLSLVTQREHWMSTLHRSSWEELTLSLLTTSVRTLSLLFPLCLTWSSWERSSAEFRLMASHSDQFSPTCPSSSRPPLRITLSTSWTASPDRDRLSWTSWRQQLESAQMIRPFSLSLSERNRHPSVKLLTLLMNQRDVVISLYELASGPTLQSQRREHIRSEVDGA